MSDRDRYFLAQDNDSHWYVVPVKREEDWGKWLSLDSEDERSWEVPDFARGVGGSPRLVTFFDPDIE